MSEIKIIIRTKKFEKNLESVKNREFIERIKKQIKKIIENPKAGKPLKFGLKGERTLYIKPYRLIYSVRGEKLYLLRFMHRKKVYK